MTDRASLAPQPGEISPQKSPRIESLNLIFKVAVGYWKYIGIYQRGALSSQRGEGQG